jgi:adenylate kinase
MKVLLLGAPASGKSTIGDDLAEMLGVPYVKLGETLRDLPEEHPDYAIVHQYMDKGELVPVDVTSELLKERLGDSDCTEGFVLDGWGRRMLDLGTYDPGFDVVLFLKVSKDSARKRITGRRVCTTDDAVYNIFSMTKEELKQCEGKLVQREDDTEEVFNRRWEIHLDETLAVVDYFKQRNILREVDAEPSPEKVLQNAIDVLGDS